MAASSWRVEFGDIEALENKLKQIPGKSEQTLNKTLHSDGVNLAVESIQPKIPVSTWKGRVRNKRHAKDQKSLTNSKLNLGFTIRPTPRFNYLKYPDLGIGTSKKNAPEKILEHGLQTATPKIAERLNIELDKVINQTMGG
ncbi:hypothetical protein BK784_23515 [Bacillus thuringiensis serovar medellin]|uniref:HK97 gp10 family phage protein n=1 Tax=Bacillus thuringiensis subsp. medellin TaxID=79672 RepID=A0A9X6RBQ6_BACTV|nr:hypothetical protein [Bacillus thuringiensis]OUB89496.1 hypothetical protein BK784_26725 [Bacillus thuringiensis serovar medellin]OUB89592.1 hypothetical protein BK784_26675 [Bacillus thuringiensis serovar medellin]OUB92330.1 hypothetical protein BK784_23515 [Bacillus thuringiensis serovar medellin]